MVKLSFVRWQRREGDMRWSRRAAAGDRSSGLESRLGQLETVLSRLPVLRLGAGRSLVERFHVLTDSLGIVWAICLLCQQRRVERERTLWYERGRQDDGRENGVLSAAKVKQCALDVAVLSKDSIDVAAKERRRDRVEDDKLWPR